MSSDNTLSLAALGRELDQARRGRSHDDSALSAEETDSLSSLSTPMTPHRSLSTTSSASSDIVTHQERPYPLCLLCLSRPPSAVLLPCCHLNLCYLCAPLLLVRHQSPTQSLAQGGTVPQSGSIPPGAVSLEIDGDPSSSLQESRLPWNTVLARATANHPKSRRLSMGGYVAPKIGTKGGEMTVDDLLPGFCNAVTPGLEKTTGMTRTIEDGGRVVLAHAADEHGGGPKCLMCRTGVKGWLRVYSG